MIDKFLRLFWEIWRQQDIRQDRREKVQQDMER
jgi:hypothetical protein